MSELKPCPFCGSRDVEMCQSDDYFVKCEECGAQGPLRFHKENARKAWNDCEIKEVTT